MGQGNQIQQSSESDNKRKKVEHTNTAQFPEYLEKMFHKSFVFVNVV